MDSECKACEPANAAESAAVALSNTHRTQFPLPQINYKQIAVYQILAYCTSANLLALLTKFVASTDC